MTLYLPPPHPRSLYKGWPASRAIPDLQAIIEDAIRNRPRSLQKQIGPSSLGCECDRCLVAELAGLLDNDDASWMPTIGVALGEWLEGVIIKHLMDTGSDRYIPEGRVTVGQVGGLEIGGNTDVFDTWTGTVIDYKLIGTTTLRKLRREGASTTYRRQVQVYGKGWEDAGYCVTSVAVWGLPRNGFHIGDGYLHQEDYDRSEAERTIRRADMFAAGIRYEGVDAVLARCGPHTGTEFSCPSPQTEQTLARAGQPVQSLTL